MSLEAFIRKCTSWGLLPNHPHATEAYKNMKVMPPMHVGAGFSRMLKKLCMVVPDLDGVDSLEQLKKLGAKQRLSVVLTCHEILHNLHFEIDQGSFNARSKAKIGDWDNEEEQLTITGDTGTVALPSTVMVACNPRLFNEHSLCRILKLSNRPNHHSSPDDVSSASNVDLAAEPKGIPWWRELETVD